MRLLRHVIQLGWFLLVISHVAYADDPLFPDPDINPNVNPVDTTTPRSGASPSTAADSASKSEPQIKFREVQFPWSPMWFSLDWYFGFYKPQNYVAIQGDGAIVKKNILGGELAFEFIPTTLFGKPAVGIQSGYYPTNDVTRADGGTANSVIIPSLIYIAYRLDFIRNQPLVPFVKWGKEITVVRERVSTDTTNESWHRYEGNQMIFGGELCLYWFEPSTAKLMDSSYGVNATYLVFEYVKSTQSNSAAPNAVNLSGTRYRFSLRFEF